MFARIFAAPTTEAGVPERLMIDSTYLKVHRTAASLLQKSVRRIGCTRGRLNSKLHAVYDEHGRPVALLLSEGHMIDHKSARLLLPVLPLTRELRADLAECGIVPCIPPTKDRTVALSYDKALYCQRHRIEKAFGRLKDWRHAATRYDRCAHTFFSTICLAAAVIFWLP